MYATVSTWPVVCPLEVPEFTMKMDTQCVCVCVGGGGGGCARARLSLREIAQPLKTVNLARPNLIIQILNLHNGRFLADADFERLSELLHTRWRPSPSNETRTLLHFAQANALGSGDSSVVRAPES